MQPLDEIDIDIVGALQHDGRMSVNALAGAVGISRANAYRRLDRLIADGVIRGFGAEVDHSRVGQPLTVLILISVEQIRWQTIQDQLARLDGLDHLAATTGDFDFLARVRVPDMTALRDVVLRDLRTIPGVVSTRTVFVLDELTRRDVRSTMP